MKFFSKFILLYILLYCYSGNILGVSGNYKRLVETFRLMRRGECFCLKLDHFLTVIGVDFATNDLSLSDGKWILVENSLGNLATFGHAL